MSRFLPDLPQLLHRRGFYYGWVVLAAGTLGVVMSVPGQTMGVSVYTEDLIANLGISRVALSTAYLFGTLASAFLLPLVGRLLDKVGARVVGIMACSFLALFLAFLSISPAVTTHITGLTHLPHEWVALGVAFFAFLGIRHFGQGQLTMASRTMMGRWFERRRGLVMGFSGFFVAFGFGIAPLTLNSLITKFGWEGSLLVMAAASLCMAAVAGLAFRRSPEHCGLIIDGGPAKKDTHDAKEERAEVLAEARSFTVEEAKKTLVFWVFNAGLTAQALLVTAVTFNMAHIGELNHISTARAFSVFLPVALLSTISDLIGGYFSDKKPMKYLLAVMQLGLALGLAGLQFFGTPVGFGLTALGLGISGGLFSQLTGAAWPKLFGRQHLGAIVGASMSWMVAGSAIGPWLFSVGEAASGSYAHVLAGCLLIPLSIFAASFFIRNPRLAEEEAEKEDAEATAA